MAGTCMGIAKLDESKMQRLKQLEEELGTPILAVQEICHWTNLDEDRLHKLQEAEKELGLVLLAYEPEGASI
jgi:hypothetical protein